jgi:hypothetical protein
MQAVSLDLAFAEIAAVADTASVVYVVDTGVVSVVFVTIAAVYPLTMQHTPMKIAVVVAVATEEEVYQPFSHQNYHHYHGHHPKMQFLIMMSSSVVTWPTMPTLLNYDHHS